MIEAVKTKNRRPLIKGVPSNETPAQPIVWLSAEEAAKRLGVGEKTLTNWRSMRKPDQPKYSKNPGRCGRIRYKQSDIDEWLESHSHECN